VTVGYPDRAGREAILRIHTKQIPLAPDVDLVNLSRAASGLSAADLANLTNKAALLAARRRPAPNAPSLVRFRRRVSRAAPTAASLKNERVILDPVWARNALNRGVAVEHV
jgi:ATP-dependent 26S proteasome regulatory subunit